MTTEDRRHVISLIRNLGITSYNIAQDGRVSFTLPSQGRRSVDSMEQFGVFLLEACEQGILRVRS